MVAVYGYLVANSGLASASSSKSHADAELFFLQLPIPLSSKKSESESLAMDAVELLGDEGTIVSSELIMVYMPQTYSNPPRMLFA